MFAVSDTHLLEDEHLRQQVEGHPRAQELLRALLYPYAAPDHDYILRNRAVTPLYTRNKFDHIDRLLGGRVPVIAAGSNRSPRQLARKFSRFSEAVEIPVTMGWMQNYDIVYCAHLTSYGAVPATILQSPGTVVRVAINWLLPDQLHHMHATESLGDHYDYRQIPSAGITLDCGLTVQRAGAYIARYGVEFSTGDIFTLADIKAENRRLPERNQWQMLQYVARRAGLVAHPDFILRIIDDEKFRRAQNGRRPA
ncbi:hypothetical protein [Thalassospira sp. TSL5-1]|uniref:hypothetical protein n=1 Tax=Thalassospira sp. TSL5-1 TaxID=1544451 RepID=UPI00093E7C29|nr:hypothetical protein [Thalassospira sp. TSL5-1]